MFMDLGIVDDLLYEYLKQKTEIKREIDKENESNLFFAVFRRESRIANRDRE